MEQICRTCLRHITDLKFSLINSDTNSLVIANKLSFCVPQLELDLVTGSVLCDFCVNAVQSAYDFMSQCLRTEKHIRKSMEILKVDKNSVSLGEIFESTSGLVQSKTLKTPAKTKRDLIDELNDLLDDALENIEQSKNAIIENGNNVSGQREDDWGNICKVANPSVNLQTENNEIETEILSNNSSGIKECSVKLARLPSNLKLNSPKSKTSAKKHSKIVSVKRGFKCGLCKFRSIYKANVKRHMRLHNKYDFSAASKSVLGDHMKLHQHQKSKIFVSGHKTTVKSKLRLHSSEKPSPFVCNICGYSTPARKDLTIHMVIHNNRKLYTCNICDFQTIYKGNLEKHMKIHSGEKPFICNVCGYKAALKVYLTAHMVIHSNQKPFGCNVCDYESARKQSLTLHMKIHSKENS